MLIKVGNDLFRILELHHLTPGNKRAHIQVRMRNIRTRPLADQKFRAEEDVERAIARRARDAVPLQRRRRLLLHGHVDLRADPHLDAEALGDSKDYLIAEID